MRRAFIILFALMAIVPWAKADNGKLNSYAEDIRLGDSCMAAYNVSQALSYYDKAMAGHPMTSLRMKIFDGYYLQHNYAKCISMVEDIPIDSLSHDTMCHLFHAYKALGLSNRTMEMGEAVVSRWPLDGEMVASLGREYLSAGKNSKALKLCVGYWLRDNSCVAVNNVMSDVYMVQRQWGLAMATYRLLLQQGDSTYKNMLGLGVCYERMGNAAEARKAFDVAIAMSDSMAATPLYHQGAVLNELKDYAASMDCFNKALALLRPDSAVMFSCYRGLAEGYYASNDFRRALPEFQRAQDYSPKSVTTPYYIGICKEATGDKSKAKAAYQQFLQLAAKEEKPGEELKTMIDDAKRRIQKLPAGNR